MEATLFEKKTMVLCKNNIKVEKVKNFLFIFEKSDASFKQTNLKRRRKLCFLKRKNRRKRSP